MGKFLLVLAMLASQFVQAQEPEVIENAGGFVEGTRVWTPWGATNIQNLVKGDVVLAYDLATGEVVESKISQVFVFYSEDIAEMEIGNETFYLNADHRFYSPTDSDWHEASSINSGFTVLNKDGETVNVSRSRSYSRKYKLIELTIEDHANYFVGEAGILVHNFAITVPIATWIIGEGLVWATAATIAAAIAMTAADYIMTQSKYCEGENIGLERFSEKKKHNGRWRLTDPKTGEWLDPDNSPGNPHGGSHWKLRDRKGKRIGTITCDGKFLRE